MRSQTKRLLLVGFSAVLGLWAAPSPAQDAAATEWHSYLALTFCEQAEPVTFYRSDVVTSPMMPVIVAHEAVHRMQIAAHVQATGHCPAWLDARTLLRDEMQAYCATIPVYQDAVHVERGDAWDDAVDRMQHQFQGIVKPEDVARVFGLVCPKVLP